MPEIYRVAVIGNTGRGNYGHGVDTVWLDIPRAEIVGVADPNPNGLKAAAARLETSYAVADWRKLLDEQKPDIVAICPRWIDQHLELVLAAAERGMHIYMEKPFCRTLEEADQIIAACNKKKVKLALAHQTRYSPKLPVIRDLILDGQLGEILEMRGRGKEDRRGGGEDLWVLGSHIMNLIHHIGGEPLSCFAVVKQDGHPITKDDVKEGNEGIGPLAGDDVSAMYELEDGVKAYFGSRRNTAGGRFGLRILGSKGVIDTTTGFLPPSFFLPDPSWNPGRSGKAWIPVSSAGLGKPEPLADGSHTAGNIAACRDLIDAIEEDRQPECSMYEGRTTIEMIAAVFESQRQGKPVSIPLATRKNPLTLL